MAKNKSIEPQVADFFNRQMTGFGLDYKLEQEDLDNLQITKALKIYESKSGGVGGNRPDVKLLLADEREQFYPVMIEYKGDLKALEKLNSQGVVDNSKPAHITGYAVNGAVHYANAILEHTTFDEVISIGITGGGGVRVNQENIKSLRI